MKLRHRAVAVLALGALLAGAPGCMEDIALFPRPTLPEGQPDVVGSVERVDLAARRLYLRCSHHFATLPSVSPGVRSADCHLVRGE